MLIEGIPVSPFISIATQRTTGAECACQGTCQERVLRFVKSVSTGPYTGLSTGPYHRFLRASRLTYRGRVPPGDHQGDHRGDHQGRPEGAPTREPVNLLTTPPSSPPTPFPERASVSPQCSLDRPHERS